jgi:hypothetical protein
MSKSKDNELTQVQIIAWAIPRIAGGHYVYSDDERGQKLTISESEPTLEQMEVILSRHPDKNVQDVLHNLKIDCSLTNIQTLYNLLMGEKLGKSLASQFSCNGSNPPYYELVIIVGYKQLLSLTNSLQHFHVKGREGLSVNWLANLERNADPNAVTIGIVTHYAKEISNLFPKMIQRAEKLRIIPVEDKVPLEVQHYIEEASKCYIYGRFVACLIVCRSSIEFALRDRLLSRGQKKALDEMKLQREESLYNLIKLARPIFPKTFKPTFDDADEIRREAKNAVHSNEPKPELCKDMFIKTRGVLSELYAIEVSRAP